MGVEQAQGKFLEKFSLQNKVALITGEVVVLAGR